MAAMNNWAGIRNELGDIGDLDETRAFQPGVLREWFSVVLTCTDNKTRKKVEKALNKLTKRHETVEVVVQIIQSDPDVNIRCFGATYLANNCGNFVDIILQTDDSQQKLEMLKEILSFCLKSDEMPSNIRAILLKGFGLFMFKVIPDIWSDAVEQLVHSQTNPLYVIEVLSDLCNNVVNQPQAHSLRRKRNDYLLQAQSIVTYVYQAIESSENVQLSDKASELIKNFWVLSGAVPETMFPLVTKIFESKKFTFQTVTNLTAGIRMFPPKLFPRCLSTYIQYLISHVNGPLIEAIQRSIRMVSVDEMVDHDHQMVELTAELCDFYGYLLSSLASLAFCRRSDGDTFPMLDEILEAIFKFVIELSKVPGKPGHEDPFSEMNGMFYNRLYEALFDVMYNVGPDRMKSLGQALEPALEPTFIKSRTGPTDFEEDVEAIERFRESNQDLILLLDLLSDHEIIPLMTTALLGMLNDKGSQDTVKVASISVFYYYLNVIVDIPPLQFLPHSSVLETTLNTICIADVSDKQKEECVCQFLTFVSSLVDKDQEYASLVGEVFNLVVPFIFGFCQGQKSLEASLTLIYTYSRYCRLNEKTVSELCGFLVGFSSNELPAIQKLVMTSLINFLSCEATDNEEARFPVACFILEFVESRCENCLMIVAQSTTPPNALTLRVFKEQSQIIGYIGQNTNKKALDVVSPLVSILCDYLVRLLDYKIPEPDLISFSNPVCLMVNENVIRKLSHVQVDYAWNYPDIFVRIYKEGLSLNEEFVIKELIPMISNLIASVFSASGNSQQVKNADLSTLELICYLLRKRERVFLKYVEAKSSIEPAKDFLTASIGVALKTITYSYSDEGITKGLRAIESIIGIKDPDVIEAMKPTFPLIIPPILDLVFSLFFHCGQVGISQILVFLAQKCPEVFSRAICNHAELRHNDERALILGTPNRSLFLKYFLRWNSEWSRRKENE